MEASAGVASHLGPTHWAIASCWAGTPHSTALHKWAVLLGIQAFLITIAHLTGPTLIKILMGFNICNGFGFVRSHWLL